MLENVLAGTLVALLVIFCACNILVSIRIFHAEGILKGVLGIVFWPYSIVWGWRRAKALRLRKLMWFWSSVPALVVLDLMAIAVVEDVRRGRELLPGLLGFSIFLLAAPPGQAHRLPSCPSFTSSAPMTRSSSATAWRRA